MSWKKPEIWTAVILLIGSNIFMTFAWYGHLKFKDKAIWLVILVSWGIAFFEYCLQVPANRIGSDALTPAQLKVLQEVITFSVFGIFSIYYLKTSLTSSDLLAFSLIVIAVVVSLFQPLGAG